MQFAHTFKLIAERKKTMTRRIVKPHEFLVEAEGKYPKGVFGWHKSGFHSRPVYRVGQELAVTPGRGKPTVWWRERDGVIQYAHECTEIHSHFWEQDGKPSIHPYMSDYEYLNGSKEDLTEWDYSPLRIRITEIHREDVRVISADGVFTEGFYGYAAFIKVWCDMHDTFMKKLFTAEATPFTVISEVINSRPAHLYDAWALSFEVMK